MASRTIMDAVPTINTLPALAQVLAPTPEALFSEHESLVEQVVNRFLARRRIATMEREDLLQEGKLGLLHAARRYSPVRAPFPAFASHCILGALLTALRSAGEATSTCSLTPADIATLVEPSHQDAAEARVTLAGLFEHISERDRRAIELHLLLGYTKAEVARELGMSERHAARILDDAMGQLQVLAAS